MNMNTADSGATAPDGPDAFDQAMAEFAAPESAPADAAGQQSEGQSEPPAPDLTSPPVNNPGGSEPSAGNPAPAGNPTDDVWKDVPEAARRAYEQSQATIASLKGRVSAEARRANQLQRQFSQQPVDNAGSQQGNQSGGAAPTNEVLENDQLKQFQEDYPEIAGPVVSTIAALQAKIDQLAAPVQAFEQLNEAEHAQAMLDAVAAKNPRWNAYNGDPRWDEFRATQPRFVVEAMDRNWSSISDPDEAAFVVDRFEEFIGVQATVPTSMPATASTPSADPRRQRQLDAGRDAGSHGAGAAQTGIPDDFDTAVAIFIEQDDRKRASLKR